MSDNTPPPPQEAAFFTSIRGWGITRGADSILGGVAAGVGDRIGMARMPARLILVAAGFLVTGVVLLTYAAAWALLPDRNGNIIIQNFGRGITNVGALIGIGVMAFIGLASFDHGWAANGFGFGEVRSAAARFSGNSDVVAVGLAMVSIVFSLALAGAVIYLIIYLVRRANTPPTGDDGEATPAAPAAHSAPAAAPPAPPRPPHPYVPGPGRRFYLITLAWMLICGAIIATTDRLDRLAVAPGLAWFALFMVGFGLILAAVSATGRKLGFLGFISVPLLLVALMAAVNSGEVREAYESARDAIDVGPQDYWTGGVHYDEDGNAIDAGAPVLVDPIVTDPTLAFVDDYQLIYVAPQCFTWDAMQPEQRLDQETGIIYDVAQEYASQARLTFGALTEDTVVSITAEHTVVSIPKGTNLVLRADSNAQSSIDWESRGLYCEFWDGGQDNLSLTNPGSPTLILQVHDDSYANTITVIETSPAPQTSASPEPDATPDQPTKEEAKS